MNNIIFASIISEIQQSPMFMTVKAVICDTPEANLNGARVTEAFVNEVVKNEKRYVGLPLYADVKALTNGNYNRLGHLYDVKTGEFHSTQIGSFYKFEKEKFDAGYHLIGYARIPKRNKKLSNAIAELFADGKLKFSFEVAAGECTENDDGTITIDASENNYLEGTAIVTYPACEDAVALEFVAQNQDVQEGGEQQMDTNKLTAEQAEEAKETSTEAVAAKAETAEENKEVQTEPVQAETAENTSTASVYVTETETQAREIHAYDSETGKSIHQEIVVRTTNEDAVDGTLVQEDDGIHVAEDDEKKKKCGEDNSDEDPEEVKAEAVVADAGGESGGESGTETTTETTTETPAETTETPAETPTETPAEQPSTPAESPATRDVVVEGVEDDIPNTDNNESKKTAEQMIAELTEVVESLRAEINELKEHQTMVASKTVTAEVNPMVSDINAKRKYSLLEKAEKTYNSYSLLEKY